MSGGASTVTGSMFNYIKEMDSMEPIEIDLKIVVDKPCVGGVQIVAHNGELVRNYEQSNMPLDLRDLLLAALIDRERQRAKQAAGDGKGRRSKASKHDE